MYDLIDRPVTDLSPGGRFLLWAMRGWIHAASTGQCPPGALAPAFARHGVLPALPHLHVLLGELNRNAKEKLALAPLRHRLIGDDEAVLLEMCRAAHPAPVRARATLELLLDDDAVSSAMTALLALMAQLAEADLDRIEIAAQDVDHPR